MGLSRNKVAVSEGAAGSPPFYGDHDRFSRICRSRNDEIGSTVWKLLLFNSQGSEMIFEKDTHGNGGVAQLGEHLPCKQGVMGSNPIISTTSSREDYRWKRTGNHQKKRSVAQVVRAHA